MSWTWRVLSAKPSTSADSKIGVRLDAGHRRYRDVRARRRRGRTLDGSDSVSTFFTWGQTPRLRDCETASCNRSNTYSASPTT